jgi:hypothetical protein
VAKRKVRGYHMGHPSWADYLGIEWVDRILGSCYTMYKVEIQVDLGYY